MGSSLPHGYVRFSLPPPAANTHSASVGRRPLSQAQNAAARYQSTQVTGRSSSNGRPWVVASDGQIKIRNEL